MALSPNQFLPKGERTPTVSIRRPVPQKKSTKPFPRAAKFIHILDDSKAVRSHSVLRLDALGRLNGISEKDRLAIERYLQNEISVEEIGLQEIIDNLSRIIDDFSAIEGYASLVSELREINDILVTYPPIHEIRAYAASLKNIQAPDASEPPPSNLEDETLDTPVLKAEKPVSQETVSLKRPAVTKQEAGAVALQFQADDTTEEIIPDENIISETSVADHKKIQALINRSPRTVKALAEFLAKQEGVQNIEITAEYLRENIGNIHVDLSIAIGGRPMNSSLSRAMAFTRAVFDIVNNSNLSEANLSEGILDETRIDRPLFAGDVEDLTDLEQELSIAYREIAVREVEDLWMNSAERPVVEMLLSSFGVDYVIVSNSYRASEYLLENSHNLMARLSNRGDDLARDLYLGNFMRRLSEIRVRYNAMMFEDALEVNRRDNLTSEIIITARLQESAQLKALRKKWHAAIGSIENLLRNSSQYGVLRDYLSDQSDDDRKIDVEAVRSEVLENPARLAEYLFENIGTIVNRVSNLNSSDPGLSQYLLGEGSLLEQVIHIEQSFHWKVQLPEFGQIIPGQPFQLGHKTAMINQREDGKYVLNTGALIGDLFLEYLNPKGEAAPLLLIDPDTFITENARVIEQTRDILYTRRNDNGSLSFNILNGREYRQKVA
jgi:hypothetical protein